MRALIWSLIALCQLSFAAEIVLMDSEEFNFIEHQRGRLEYAKRLAPLLVELGVKSEDFSVGDSDQVFEALAFDYKWSKVYSAVEAACRIHKNKKTCAAIAQVRIDTFDFIKTHPQGGTPD